jgi:hypothetical protein
LTYACLGTAALAAVRPNVAFLLLIANLLFIAKRFGRIKALATVGIAVLIVLGVMAYTVDLSGVLNSIFSIDLRLQAQELFLNSREASGDSALKLAVGNLLLPHSTVDLILYAPIRTIVWLFLPYPLIIPDLSTIGRLLGVVRSDSMEFFALGPDLSAIASTWLMICLSPYVLASCRLQSLRESPQYRILLVNLLVPAMIIGNLQLLMGRRYRGMIEPLFLAMAIWGYCHGQPKKYFVPVYSLFGAGLLLYLIH